MGGLTLNSFLAFAIISSEILSSQILLVCLSGYSLLHQKIVLFCLHTSSGNKSSNAFLSNHFSIFSEVIILSLGLMFMATSINSLSKKVSSLNSPKRLMPCLLLDNHIGEFIQLSDCFFMELLIIRICENINNRQKSHQSLLLIKPSLFPLI